MYLLKWRKIYENYLQVNQIFRISHDLVTQILVMQFFFKLQISSKNSLFYSLKIRSSYLINKKQYSLLILEIQQNLVTFIGRHGNPWLRLRMAVLDLPIARMRQGDAFRETHVDAGVPAACGGVRHFWGSGIRDRGPTNQYQFLRYIYYKDKQ